MQEKTPKDLAQEQLDAYNNRDIEAFLKPYDKECEIYTLESGEMTLKGHDDMRKRYSNLFEARPLLHANVVNRMVLGKFVIDQEEVKLSDTESTKAIAIYQTGENLIKKVWFIR